MKHNPNGNGYASTAAGFLTLLGLALSMMAPAQNAPAQNPAKDQASITAWTKANDERLIETEKSIRELEPLLERGATGLLELKKTAPSLVAFPPRTQALYLNAAKELNAAIKGGRLVLDRDLNVWSTADLNGLGSLENLWCSLREPSILGGNWFGWRWWGYQAGLDHNKTNRIWWYFDQASVVLDSLASIGAPIEVAWPFYIWVQGYSYFLHSKDRGNGVMLTATWGNFWCPVVHSQ